MVLIHYLSGYAGALILTACGLLALCMLLKAKKPGGFPPGVSGLPMIGYLPFMGRNPAKKFFGMKRKYGSVMSVKVGSEYWVVLNDYEAVYEALVKQAESFSGRPEMFQREGTPGVIGRDYGDGWKCLRKFGVTTLRRFGFGKKSLERDVVEEMSYFIDLLPAKNGHTLKAKLDMAVANIICKVVLGSRFEYDDEKFSRVTRIVEDLFGDTPVSKVYAMGIFVPAVKYIPFIRQAWKQVVEEIEALKGFICESIEEHRKTLDENDVRDFVDAFLHEAKRREEGDALFSDDAFQSYLSELFQAGTDTTSSTIFWSILCIVHYPQYQDKIHEEIVDIIGTGAPSMKHRDRMPYTCAFIQEIMRHRTLVPLSVFHKTNDDCTLLGYRIPKNTTICPNLWAVHFDPDHFEDPDKFMPERFLDSAGNFVPSNHVIPFSIGPRVCLGEQLARVEIFIFLTNIVQKYRIIEDPARRPPPFHEGNLGLATYQPPDFEVIFESRDASTS